MVWMKALASERAVNVTWNRRNSYTDMSPERGYDWGIAAYGFFQSVILAEIAEAHSCFLINDFQGESRGQSDTL
jgi:hypothetical protein